LAEICLFCNSYLLNFPEGQNFLSNQMSDITLSRRMINLTYNFVAREFRQKLGNKTSKKEQSGGKQRQETIRQKFKINQK